MNELTQEDMTAIDNVIAVELMDWHKHSPDSDEPEVWFWYKDRGITAYSAAYPFQPTQDAKAAMEVRQRLTELGFVWLADYGIGAEFVYRFTLRYRGEVVSSVVAESELEAQVLAVCEKRDGAWHVRKELTERVKEKRMSECCPVIRKIGDDFGDNGCRGTEGKGEMRCLL
jgi:hypothetical protein